MSRLDPEQFRKIDQAEDDPDARLRNALTVLITSLAPDNDERMMGPNEKVAHAVNRINDIVDENERLRERVSELESVVTPHPESKDYQDLTRDEKVQQLRESLVEKASARQNGRFSMGYKDVMWLFDGQPSAGHCYRLMDLAGEATGFDYAKFEDRPNQIRVNIDGVNDETLFHAVNKAPEEVRL